MTDVPQKNAQTAAEGGSAPSRKKRTCLIGCCIGSLAAFIITGMLSIIFSGFVIELLRSLIVPK